MQKEQDRIYNHLKNQGYNPCRTKIDIFIHQGGDFATADFEDLCEDVQSTRIASGEEYTVSQHRLLHKLIALEDRIAKWKLKEGRKSIDAGDAVSEKAWNTAVEDLEHVTRTRRACSADPDYAIPKMLLREFNSMWKCYKLKKQEV